VNLKLVTDGVAKNTVEFAVPISEEAHSIQTQGSDSPPPSLMMSGANGVEPPTPGGQTEGQPSSSEWADTEKSRPTAVDPTDAGTCMTQEEIGAPQEEQEAREAMMSRMRARDERTQDLSSAGGRPKATNPTQVCSFAPTC
jgi:hypothetical protein